MKNLTALNPESESEANSVSVEDIEQFLTFSIEGESFGVALLSVHEILKPVYITRIPNVENYILGVVNLRGEIIPIIDLKKRFDLGYSELKASSRFIVVMHNEKRVGLLVDEVRQVVKVPKSDISSTQDDLSLNYNKMTESVSRYNNQLILNLGMGQVVDFA